MQKSGKVIRAGVSGTNWTGKSATIQSFVNLHSTLRIETVVLSDLASGCPYPMVEGQTPDASRWMLEEITAVLERPSDVEIQLFDRTPVDILAFTQYAFDRETTPADQTLMSDIHRLVTKFHTIFYTSLATDWPVGVAPAPSKVAFALLMDRYMNEMIDRLAIDVVRLPWELSERPPIIAECLGL